MRHAGFALLLTVIALADARPAGAIDIKLGLEARPRVEKSFGGNLGVIPDGDNLLFNQRTRLLVDTSYEWARAHVSVQDVRTWATEAGLNSFSATGVDFHEGWLELGTDWIQLRIGRQEIILDEERLVGNSNWSQQGRSFDGARLRLVDPDLYDIDAGWARIPGDVTCDFFYLHPGFHFGPIDIRAPLILQTNVMVAKKDRGANAGDFVRFTGGVWVQGTHGALSWRAEGYAQVGADPKTGHDVLASMAGARVTYKVNDYAEPTLWADYLSGDSNQLDDRVETFDTIFGTNHKFYGIFDRYDRLAPPTVSTKGAGLLDLAVKNGTELCGLWAALLSDDSLCAEGSLGRGRLQAEAHTFFFPFANRDGQSGLVGVEGSLLYKTQLAKQVGLELGDAVFVDLGDGAFRRDAATGTAIQRHNQVHEWLYLMLDANL